MNYRILSEDESSTYCSRVSSLTTPETVTPERVVVEPDQSSAMMVLPSLSSSLTPRSGRLQDTTGTRDDWSRLDGVEYIDTITSVLSTGMPTEGRSKVKSLREKKGSTSLEYSKIKKQHINHVDAVISNTKIERAVKSQGAEKQGNAVKGKKLVGTVGVEEKKTVGTVKGSTANVVSNSAEYDDDDRASSIKFVLLDGNSALLRSPTQTSIVFESEPSTITKTPPTPLEESTNRNGSHSHVVEAARGPPSTLVFGEDDAPPRAVGSARRTEETRGAKVDLLSKSLSLRSCSFDRETSLRPRRESSTHLSTTSAKSGREKRIETQHHSQPQRSKSENRRPSCSENDHLRSASRHERDRKTFTGRRGDGRCGFPDGGSYVSPRVAGGQQAHPYCNGLPVSESAGRCGSHVPQQDSAFLQHESRLKVSPRHLEEAVRSPFQQHRTPLYDPSGVNTVLELFRQHRCTYSPRKTRQKRRANLLQKIDEELFMVREEMHYLDAEMEQAMLSDPYTRLYHMNNRRDRDERRSRLLRYLSLENARSQLLNEDDDAEEKRLQRQKETKRRRNEMFDRLYKQTPTRCTSSQRSTSQKRRTPSSGFDESIYNRLYSDGQRVREWRESFQREGLKKREKIRLEELLYSRAFRHLDTHNRGRLLTPEEREQRTAVLCSKLVDDPVKLEEFLSSKKLGKEEEKVLIARLGLTKEEKLKEMRRKAEEMELRKYPFKPQIGSSGERDRTESMLSIGKPTLTWMKKKKGSEPPTPASPPSKVNSSKRHSKCEKLFSISKNYEQRRNALRASSESRKKLELLKSKLKEDHHFRRRAELDPSLAQRYMDSLVV
uniref:Uncharacterized protein n=1 Tax=Trypanosoma congolense (strain IL3000) TaxID=1068625 RepID=G0UWG5_TRYCI|nr:conserved hypothetical protein [Trypanosoma congolense IL3000]